MRSLVLSIFVAPLFLSASPYPEIEYDPEIAELIDRVSPDSISHIIASISGEIPVTVDGEQDSLATRWAYSPGSYRAALWLSECLESCGLETEIVEFIPVEVRSLDLLPSGQGWAAGWNGHEWTGHGSGILRTADAGESWEQVTGIRGYGWESVVTLSLDSAWAVSSEGRIGAVADGLTWNYMVVGILPLYDISAVSSTKGWAVGDSGVLLETADAWQTYSQERILAADLRHVQFISDTRGWVASTEHLWYTVDGGEGWDYVDQPLAEITDLFFSDSLSGFMSGRTGQGRGGIYRTLDRGLNWEPLIDTLRHIPRSLAARGDTVWSAGDGGMMVSTFDRGQHWISHQAPSPTILNCIDFLPDGRLVAGGDEELFISRVGESWLHPDTAGIGLMWNVVATLPGQSPGYPMILITAHFDARSEDNENYTPGADDNGTGVACVIEAARVLSQHHPRNTIEFVLFSGEEVGLFGSHRYVSEAAGTDEDILAVLNADMFGFDSDADHVIDVNSNPEDPRAQAAAKVYLDVVDVYNIDLDPHSYVADAKPNSDHYYFWQEMIPALFLNEDRNDYNPFYHTTGDRIHALDPSQVCEGVRSSVGWLAHLAGLDSLVYVEDYIVSGDEPVTLLLSSSVLSYSGWLEVGAPCRVRPLIYDASGRVVKRMSAVPGSSQPRRLVLDVSDLACGVYWVGVRSDMGVFTEKFTVIR